MLATATTTGSSLAGLQRGPARRMRASASAFAGNAATFRAPRAVAAQPRGSRRTVTTMGLFGLGAGELVVIAGVAVLIFGPSKLPDLGKSLGKTVKSFQSAAKEFETELQKEKNAGAAPADAAKTEAKTEEKK